MRGLSLAELLVYLDAMQKIGLLLGGSIGLYLAWLRVSAANRQADASLHQAELARRAHVAELFNRAVGQLADDKLEVRLGAIYTLREIAADFPDLTGPVFELLSTYVRGHLENYGDREPPADIRAIMSVLQARLEAPHDES